MRQVPPMVQAHPQNRLPGIEQRQVYRRVRLRPGMRLHVRVGRPKQLLGAVDRQLLGQVHKLAPPVVALARIAFRILVRQHRALRLQHPRAGIVLRGDQLDVIFLASPLAGHRLGQFRIKPGYRHRGIEHVREVSRKIAEHYKRSLDSPGR